MKKDEIKQKRPFAPGIQWQLMLFIGGITLFTLLLVWGIITYALEPQYNRNIRAKLDSKTAAITALIDQSDAEISSRTYQGLYLNDEFWSGVSQTFRDKKINVDGNCVDFSDSTLRCLKAYESMYPCLLHESTGAFGGEFGYNLDTRIAIQLRQKLFQDGSLYQIVKIGSSMQMCVGRLSADGQYGVIVSASLAQITTAAEVLRAILGPVALILLVLDLLLAILFSRWFTNPIRKLSNGAQEIAAGNYDVAIKVEHHDEIGRLAEDFNYMAAEVKRSAQLEKDILANVSHDLRTPLTLIKGYAETVRDLTGDDKAHRDEQMNIIVDEADRLTALVSSVMELSKVTSGTYKCERVHFDMGQLCDEVSERYDAVCAQNGWQLQLELPEEELPVYADPDMMQRALHNLLGNAMHHIGQDGIFILRAFRCSEGVRVEVEDHGPGIAAADLPYIFDRYYRSRSDAGKQGTGLGLSITKAIFQQHSFRFGVQSTVGKGTTFWFVMSDLPYVDDFEGK